MKIAHYNVSKRLIILSSRDTPSHNTLVESLFDTDQVEKTFGAENDVGWNFDYKLGPQRATLSKTGRKLAWELKESILQKDGTVLQSYIRRGDDARWVDGDNKPLNEHDSIIQLVWSSNT